MNPTYRITFALIMSIPVCFLFNRSVAEIVQNKVVDNMEISTILPIIMGCLIVIILVLTIVGWQIRKVMKMDPAKIITKE